MPCVARYVRECYSKVGADYRARNVDQPGRFHCLHYVGVLDFSVTADVVGKHNRFKFLQGVLTGSML
jgi:hypothetical protein